MAAKILSKLSSIGVDTSVFGEEMGSILDNVFVLCKTYTQNNKEAKRIVKKSIKIAMKLRKLFKKGDDYLIDLSFEFEDVFLKFASKVICFCEDDTIYNQECLIKLLNGCKDLLKQMFLPHLKETSNKSLGRINFIFGFITNPAFLDAIFTHPDYKVTMGALGAMIYQSCAMSSTRIVMYL